MSVLLTGATGFLGRYLAKALVDGGERVTALVRAPDDARAKEKLHAALASIGGAPSMSDAIDVVRGSLDRPRLGLSLSDLARVVAETSSIVHCGATVRFDLPLAEARRTNVDGTRALLELAARCPSLARVDYVGTAYVAGRRTDVVREDELEHDAGHKNSYEQTKYEAERMVRDWQKRLPIAIHRPSIVVGEAASGRTSSFKMIYWPARIYASGLWRTVPGSATTPIDLVPVDFVRDAILALRRDPSTVGGCFHLAAGPSGAVRLGDMAQLLGRLFPRSKPVRFVDPAWWMRWVHPVLKRVAVGPSRKVIRTGEHYVPYFTQNPVFDNRVAARHFVAAGVEIPDVNRYVTRLFDYCVETDWGARPLRKTAMTSSSAEKK